jgi:hypothetical protein
MGGYSSIDDLIQKITVDRQVETVWWGKQFSVASQATATWFSYWYGEGFPTAGANPSALGTVYVNGAGGITFPDRAPSEKYLLTGGATTGYGSPIALVDRLVAVGNVNMSAGSKPINTPALPRYTDGEGVQAWLEVTTGGSGGTLFLSSYTNQDGVAGRVGGSYPIQSFSTNVNNGFHGPLPLQAGDTGIRSIQTIQVTASSTTTCNVVLCKWISTPVSTFSGTYNERDHTLLAPRFPRIYDGATLVPVALQIGLANTMHGCVQIGWV